jgi:acetyl esterase/lipase
MASPQLQTVVNFLRNSPIRSGAQMPLDVIRQAFDGVSTFFPLPGDATREPADADGVPGAWIRVPESGPTTLYYLHGGGYTIGSIDSHAAMISRIARAARAEAFAIDYRLAPEHRFPAAVEDATTAYRWLLKQGVDPASIVISGDSAGGGLTVATLVALRDAGDPLPAVAAVISPWTDLTCTGESMKTRAELDPMIPAAETSTGAANYLGDESPTHPLASPLYADLQGLPPMLIQVGDHEVLLDDSTRLAERAKAAGVDVTLEVWDEMIHVWHFFASILPEGQQGIDRIGEFVRQKVGVGAVA